MKTHPQTLDSHAGVAMAAILSPAVRPVADQHPNQGWMPRPWSDEVHGCVFLLRLLAKGRQALRSEDAGRDLLNGYLFGDFDYADGSLLRFLRTDEARVRALLRESGDDEAVAAKLLRESRRSSGEIKAWSRSFRRVNALFAAMWDADEGRRAPGWGTSLLHWFYNSIMMPPVYVIFRRQTERRRRRQGASLQALV